MKKQFAYEFEDDISGKTISFEYDNETEENLTIDIEGDIPVIYANRQALIFLAKIFIKMSMGTYDPGFHVHVHQELDADKSEALRIILTI